MRSRLTRSEMHRWIQARHEINYSIHFKRTEASLLQDQIEYLTATLTMLYGLIKDIESEKSRKRIFIHGIAYYLRLTKIGPPNIPSILSGPILKFILTRLFNQFETTR